jgi:hypothetical protein
MREQFLLVLQRLKLHSAQSMYEELRRDPEISAFVASYYADDFALRERALAEMQASSLTTPSAANFSLESSRASMPSNSEHAVQ